MKHITGIYLFVYLFIYLFVIYLFIITIYIQQNKVKKRTLFNKIRQHNIHIFKYRTKQIKTIETSKKVTYLNWNGSLTKML